MEINSVGYSANATAAAPATTASAAEKPAEQKETAGVSDAAVYEPGKQDKSEVSATDIARMLEETNRQTEALREMILKMLNNQANKDAVVTDTWPEGMQLIEIDEETRKKAQEDIAEGGYYSVENTGDRILDFAFALAGNDPAKLEQMREAALAGFDEAEKLWGGKLPQISYDTLEYVKKGFEDKFAELNGAEAAS